MSTVMPESLAEGRFRLLEVIGEGGMATVYRAFDLRLQRPRAIKVLSPTLALRPALRKRFLAEAQTMAGLEESRVVRVFDTGEDGDRVYIVMELVEGGSLLDRVHNFGPLPPRMAAEATIQICESLQAAHDAGVIHRDIKPHNILLTRTGEIRVTDFGIAQVHSDSDDGMTKTGAVMGTWGFMAPEQKSNAKQVDVRADIYSVGATLWALLRAETPPELFMAESEPSLLVGLPEELAEVIKRATRYRREDRYVSARAMASSLRALVLMLPEDPELTVPLVGHTLERPSRPMDTMQQFASEVHPADASPGAPPAHVGTMVPSFSDLEPALPAAPPPEAPSVAPSPGAPSPSTTPPSLSLSPTLTPGPRPVDTFTRDPAPSRLPWVVAAVAVLGALALTVTVGGFLLYSASATGQGTAIVDPAVDPTNGDPAVAAANVDPAVAAAPPADPAPADPTILPEPAADPTSPSGATAPVAAAPSSRPATASNPKTSAPPKAAAVAVATPETSAPVEAAVVAEPAPARPQGLVHTPPGPAKVGESIPFAVSLPDAGWTVKLYFRPASGGAFDNKPMKGERGTYATAVKATDAMAGGVAYFVTATKGSEVLKEGSGTSPKRVEITP